MGVTSDTSGTGSRSCYFFFNCVIKGVVFSVLTVILTCT